MVSTYSPLDTPAVAGPAGAAVPPGRWYALVVHPRHEKAVGERLRMGGLESLAPTYRATRRWSDRVKTVELPLFDGYVFCEFAFEQRIQVLRTPGVQSVVGFGGTPACIPAGEIEVVRSILRSGAAAQPWPYLRTGQRVRIVDGCLRGAVGILARERNLCRVVVSIEILQRSVAVEVDRGRLAPA